MKSPRTIEVLNLDGAVTARFVGFKELRKGDRFRVLDEAGEGGPVWIALSEPYQVRKQLAIRAKEMPKALPLLRT